MDLFTLSVSLVAVVIGLIVFFVVLRVAIEAVALVGLRPGFVRAVLGLIGGTIALPVLVGLLRFLLQTTGFIDPNLVVSNGTVLFFAGFGGLTGWLWGIGGFLPQSHEHNGLEHLAEQERQPNALARAFQSSVRGAPGFFRALVPMLPPLFIALTVCIIVVVIFMALGMIPTGATRVQTNTEIAAATTPAGSIVLGDSFVINKTLFFAIIALVVLGGIATLAIVLAFAINALSKQVDSAKKAPAEPPTEEPVLFRLIDFYVSWAGEVLDGARRSVSR